MKPTNSTKSRCQEAEWVCLGADLSLATLSIGGLARTAQGKLRSGAVAIRWTRLDDYYERLRMASKASETLLPELFSKMGIEAGFSSIYLAYEEPVALGHIKNAQGAFIKQQIQISGAFVGPLLSAGFSQVYEIAANQWRAMVAHDLGITIYYKKWNDPELVNTFHCHPKNVGKFRARQWVEKFHPKWDGHWTDIISSSKMGSIPRPEDSKAMGIQSDDRYEALAMAEFMRRTRKDDLK